MNDDVGQPFELPGEDEGTRYKFSFSNLEDNKADMEALVTQLGGTTSDEMADDTTHFITAKPSRTARHLIAVAAGKWVLTPAYMEACTKAEAFVGVT